jgi:hypothetical protein
MSNPVVGGTAVVSFVASAAGVAVDLTAFPTAFTAVSYTSSDPTVATVDASGNVAYVAPGSVTFTVSGTNVAGTVESGTSPAVTVTPAVPVVDAVAVSVA